MINFPLRSQINTDNSEKCILMHIKETSLFVAWSKDPEWPSLLILKLSFALTV